MIVGDIAELSVAQVFDRGVANKECIAISVLQTINMGRYGIMLGQHQAGASGGVLPYFDNLFWFGDGIVNAGDWVFVYTGPGTPTHSLATNGVNTIFSLHWGKPHTVFANSTVVPVLFRVDAVEVLVPPSDQPQLTRLSG